VSATGKREVAEGCGPAVGRSENKNPPRCPKCGVELKALEYVGLSVSAGIYDGTGLYEWEEEWEVECVYRCGNCNEPIAQTEGEADRFLAAGELPEQREVPKRLREVMG